MELYNDLRHLNDIVKEMRTITTVKKLEIQLGKGSPYKSVDDINAYRRQARWLDAKSKRLEELDADFKATYKLLAKALKNLEKEEL